MHHHWWQIYSAIDLCIGQIDHRCRADQLTECPRHCNVSIKRTRLQILQYVQIKAIDIQGSTASNLY